jgi:hypothetical protein
MRWRRTFFIVVVACLTCISCGQRRATWSLSEEAIDSLELATPTLIENGGFDAAPSDRCRAVLSLELPQTAFASSHSPSDIRARLTGATDVQFDCAGTCADTSVVCKLHHMVDSPDPQWAATGCVCDPQTLPPCRLIVKWGIGESSRRRIDHIGCGEETESPSCDLLFFATRQNLQIVCQASE